MTQVSLIYTKKLVLEAKSCSLPAACPSVFMKTSQMLFLPCFLGWQGVDCSIPCSSGSWGLNCNQTCSCSNGASCRPADGFCLCSPGWQGEFCDQPCPVSANHHLGCSSTPFNHSPHSSAEQRAGEELNLSVMSEEIKCK